MLLAHLLWISLPVMMTCGIYILHAAERTANCSMQVLLDILVSLVFKVHERFIEKGSPE